MPASTCVRRILKSTFSAASFALFASFCSAATDPLESLIKRPLFQPDKAATAAGSIAAAAPARIEFGGFLIQGGNPAISLTDLTTGQAVFVGLRDPKAAYWIEALDQNTPAVTLRLNGQVVTLRLRQSTEAATTPTQPAATTPAQALINDAGAPAELVVTSPAPKLPAETPPQPGEPFRIPRQELRLPPRADDPPKPAR